jgi:hypothetical protein
VEGENGSLDELFSTPRLSPGEARIANLLLGGTVLGLLEAKDSGMLGGHASSGGKSGD